MTHLKPGRKGQALLLVTFALFAMCGLLGLAVDLGWGYFLKKSAQASADAGALAAAQKALQVEGQFNTTAAGAFFCDNTKVICAPTPQNCDGAGNLLNGCQYAEQNGFAKSNLRISADLTANTPAPNGVVNADYWVTVRAVQTVPQLFSAVLGNPTGISSARATAAVVPVFLNGELWTLNRQFDQAGPNAKGVNVFMGGGDQIIVPGGLLIASQADPAAHVNGGATVTGPISVVSPGNASALGSNVSDMPAGPQFLDPFQGFGQPPLPAAALPTFGIPRGALSNGVYPLAGNTMGGIFSGTLPSGNYIPINCNPCKSGGVATLDTTDHITLNQTVTFSDPSGFGHFLVYGGLDIQKITLTMDPGEFVIVGGGIVNGGSNFGDLVTTNKGFIDGTGTGSIGNIIILTGSSSNFVPNGGFAVAGNTQGDLYPGLVTQINSNLLTAQMALNGSLAFGGASLLSGADQASATVTPIVAGKLPSSDSGLAPFGGVVLWQDQANSTIRYTTPADTPSTLTGSGYVDTFNCAGASLDSPCTKSLPNTNSPGFHFQANPSGGFQGIVYQPRGAWIDTLGGPFGGIQGAIQLITGSLHMQGGGTINLTPPLIPLKRRIVALIE